MVSVLNEDNNRTIDFTIVTSVVKEISMNQIKEYLVNGSSSAMPGEAFQALDIVLKNRPFSLRLVNNVITDYILCPYIYTYTFQDTLNNVKSVCVLVSNW